MRRRGDKKVRAINAPTGDVSLSTYTIGPKSPLELRIEKRTAWTAYLVSQFLIYSFKKFLEKKTSCIGLLNNKLLLRLFFVLRFCFCLLCLQQVSKQVFHFSVWTATTFKFVVTTSICVKWFTNHQEKLKDSSKASCLTCWKFIENLVKIIFEKLSLEFILMESFSFIS